ncbi:MAG: rhomboid family intramembrane serine protease, partial [Nanoarchaeota archaeon]|nr:rhomboid family intramembrane serine protease [Nanoarchaeota archaeon]
WTLITHMFLHGSFEHLFYNMFALGLFGLILEKVIGSKKFIILYFVSGLIAALGSIMFYSASLGASGAIFGILGCLTVLRPRMTVYVSYIPLPMIIAAAVWIGGDLIGMVAPDRVAHAAHLFGMFFGIAVGLYYRKQLGENLFRKHFNLWENR